MTGRTLLLLRHAKSSWDDPALEDFDRPLARRGREAAPLIGREMVRRGWTPEMAIVSPALRTRQSWDLVARELPATPDLLFEPSIYEAVPEALLTAIRRLPNRIATAVLVGHNPGMERLAAMLCGPESDTSSMARMKEKFPTAAAACLTFDTDWHALCEQSATLTAFLTPRDLVSPRT